eukprot:4098463-Prymnesium_polylepis.1
MLEPIDQPPFAFRSATAKIVAPVARACRWPAQRSASTVCRFHPAHQCTDTLLLRRTASRAPLRERQDAAAAQQRLRQD